MENPHYLTIGQGTVFKLNHALNTSITEFSKIRGSGGSLFYTCSEKELDCFVDISDTLY